MHVKANRYVNYAFIINELMWCRYRTRLNSLLISGHGQYSSVRQIENHGHLSILIGQSTKRIFQEHGISKRPLAGIVATKCNIKPMTRAKENRYKNFLPLFFSPRLIIKSQLLALLLLIFIVLLALLVAALVLARPRPLLALC
jgi:hypothetical protein